MSETNQSSVSRKTSTSSVISLGQFFNVMREATSASGLKRHKRGSSSENVDLTIEACQRAQHLAKKMEKASDRKKLLTNQQIVTELYQLVHCSWSRGKAGHDSVVAEVQQLHLPGMKLTFSILIAFFNAFFCFRICT